MGILRSALGRAAKGAARSAGKAVEKALFGDLDDEDEKPAPPPDPFAKLKAAEAAKKPKKG